MLLSKQEQTNVSMLMREIQNAFPASNSGKFFPPEEHSEEYLELCYSIARLDYPSVLPALGCVLRTECDIVLRDGFPDGIPAGAGDAIVYWIVERRSRCVACNRILEKFSPHHLKIIASWLRMVALPSYAGLCFSEIKIAEKFIEKLLRFAE